MQPSLPQPLLASLSDMLSQRIGLYFPTLRWNDLERGVVAAATAFGAHDTAAWAQQLLSRPLTHSEIELLASHLTVGETYFFREPHCFEVLEYYLLPPLLHARHGQQRRLRIWSAGCCTGEEPYSIAMLLDRLLPAHDQRDTTILATDINPAFLRKAATGEYGDWSFRNTPEWAKARYFEPGKRGSLRLHERIRKRVSFSYLNLVDDNYPSLTSNTNAMDIIFCRNVLMYFNSEQARAVIDKLHGSLVEGGWLIVSPAETSSALFSRFEMVIQDGVILYRKPPVTTTSPLPPPADWPAASPAAAATTATGASIDAPPTDTAALASPDPAPTSPAQLARQHANAGQLTLAEEWCRKAIDTDKLDSANHYLLATIQLEQGRVDEAAESFTRTLYLEPGFVLAHCALGNLRKLQNRMREARRHYDNALAILETHAPEEVLAETEGMTAARLMEIIQAMRASMPVNDQ